MVYLFSKTVTEYNVICKRTASEMLIYILPMKGDHNITRRLSYHNNCYVKHNSYINKQSMLRIQTTDVWYMFHFASVVANTFQHIVTN